MAKGKLTPPPPQGGNKLASIKTVNDKPKNSGKKA